VRTSSLANLFQSLKHFRRVNEHFVLVNIKKL
jgi:hypothetical protein